MRYPAERKDWKDSIINRNVDLIRLVGAAAAVVDGGSDGESPGIKRFGVVAEVDTVQDGLMLQIESSRRQLLGLDGIYDTCAGFDMADGNAHNSDIDQFQSRQKIHLWAFCRIYRVISAFFNNENCHSFCKAV